MCDDSGPFAENELNYLISRSDAHPCAVTPTCATLNKSHTLPCCDVNAHPCAVTPTFAIPSKSNILLEGDSDVEFVQHVEAGCEVEVVDDEL